MQLFQEFFSVGHSHDCIDDIFFYEKLLCFHNSFAALRYAGQHYYTFLTVESNPIRGPNSHESLQLTCSYLILVSPYHISNPLMNLLMLNQYN
jgi:hypothetical protein